MIKPILIPIENGSVGQLPSNKIIYKINPETKSVLSNKGVDHLTFDIIPIDTEAEIVEGDTYIDDSNQIRVAVTSDKDYWEARKDYNKIISSTNKSHRIGGGTGRREDGISIQLPQLSEQSIQLLINYYNEHKCMPERVDVRMVSKGIVDEDGDWQPTRKVIRLNQQGEVDITIPELCDIESTLVAFNKASDKLIKNAKVKEKLYTEEDMMDSFQLGYQWGKTNMSEGPLAYLWRRFNSKNK